jgi:uncharacterized membrane protein
MLQLPPAPSWDALHPLIIHFPIGLLLVAPLFIVIGAVLPAPKARAPLAAALLLMLMGTASVFVAVATGEAAGKLAERTPEINAVLAHHEQLAERTRIAFTVLTLLFAAIVMAPLALRRTPSRVTTTVVPLVFLLLYGGASLLLVNTAHNGGRLVHQFSVHAIVPQQPLPPVPAEGGEGD